MTRRVTHPMSPAIRRRIEAATGRRALAYDNPPANDQPWLYCAGNGVVFEGDTLQELIAAPRTVGMHWPVSHVTVSNEIAILEQIDIALRGLLARANA